MSLHHLSTNGMKSWKVNSNKATARIESVDCDDFLVWQVEAIPNLKGWSYFMFCVFSHLRQASFMLSEIVMIILWHIYRVRMIYLLYHINHIQSNIHTLIIFPKSFSFSHKSVTQCNSCKSTTQHKDGNNANINYGLIRKTKQAQLTAGYSDTENGELLPFVQRIVWNATVVCLRETWQDFRVWRMERSSAGSFLEE